MTPDTILAEMQREPFCPFRLKLRNGRSYEVPHPKLLMVGRTQLVLGMLDRDRADPLFDRAIHIALENVLEIESQASP